MLGLFNFVLFRNISASTRMEVSELNEVVLAATEVGRARRERYLRVRARVSRGCRPGIHNRALVCDP